MNNDIKAAFNAGRESVVENIPELKWGQGMICIKVKIILSNCT